MARAPAWRARTSVAISELLWFLPGDRPETRSGLRKLEPRPEAEAIRREVERLILAFPLLPLTGPVVLEALRGVGEHLLSYYDAQRSGHSPASGR